MAYAVFVVAELVFSAVTDVDLRTTTFAWTAALAAGGSLLGSLLWVAQDRLRRRRLPPRHSGSPWSELEGLIVPVDPDSVPTRTWLGLGEQDEQADAARGQPIWPGGVRHVSPVNDGLAHLLDRDGSCSCRPTCEPIANPDGSVGWLYLHHPVRNGEDS